MRLSFYGAPVRNRTRDPLITSQVLYQLSYKGERTIIADLAELGNDQQFVTRSTAAI